MTAPQHEPIVIDTTPDPDAPAEETVELFRLDGESYRIPKAPKVAYALSMIDDLDEYGSQGATIAYLRLLKRLIGVDAYRALASYEGLTAHQLNTVAKAAMTHTMSGVEDTAGN